MSVPIVSQEEVTPAPLPGILTRIIQDIIQPCGPLTQTTIPSYTGITYQEKLQKILKRIKTRARNRQDQTKLLKAYYYLGNLIESTLMFTKIFDLPLGRLKEKEEPETHGSVPNG